MSLMSVLGLRRGQRVSMAFVMPLPLIDGP